MEEYYDEVAIPTKDSGLVTKILNNHSRITKSGVRKITNNSTDGYVVKFYCNDKQLLEDSKLGLQNLLKEYFD